MGRALPARLGVLVSGGERRGEEVKGRVPMQTLPLPPPPAAPPRGGVNLSFRAQCGGQRGLGGIPTSANILLVDPELQVPLWKLEILIATS